MLIRISVVDKDYSNRDGYTLISNPEQKLEYNKINQIEIGGVTF